MNVCILSGWLMNNALAPKTESHALFFTLVTKFGYDKAARRNLITGVRCVMFDPSPEIEKLLVEKGKKLAVETEGYVRFWRYNAKGGCKLEAEVVVKNDSFTVWRRFQGRASQKGGSP